MDILPSSRLLFFVVGEGEDSAGNFTDLKEGLEEGVHVACHAYIEVKMRNINREMSKESKQLKIIEISK